jgi:hypothetical protein
MAELDGGADTTEITSTDTGTADEGGGFDVETASADLASNLFPESKASSDAGDATDSAVDAAAESEKPVVPEVTARSAPKAWAKEMHEYYGKLDPAVQDYIEQREKQMMDGLGQYREFNDFGRQMRDAIAPYQDLIQEAGVDAPRAVQALLNAHRMLSKSSPEQKQQYFAKLAQDYGIDLGQQQGEQAQIDPTVKALMDKVSNLEGTLTRQQQAERDAAYKTVTNEVNEFAADKAHPYFDEVADDIVTLLKTGIELKDAYEKAVWANPITRQKEIERINQETDAARAKKAQEDAQKAKAATAANVRNRDTRRTPTETNRATMRNLDDALRETQREINSRH